MRRPTPAPLPSPITAPAARRLFVVDCEAPTATPVTGPLVQFAVVQVATGLHFHGRLWDFVPDQEIPAIPVPTNPNPGISWTSLSADGSRPAVDEHEVFSALAQWLAVMGVSDPTFVSDNPAYDWQWIAAGFARAGLPNPFGYSARRIGDFAAGLRQDWRRASEWKSMRRTVHTHDPIDDALGNAEALRTLLRLPEPTKHLDRKAAR